MGARLSRRITLIYGPYWGAHCACPVDCWITMTPLPPPSGVHGEPSGGAAGVEPVRLPRRSRATRSSQSYRTHR